MKTHQDVDLEATITEIEIKSRAELSEQDIDQNRIRSYDEFSNEIKGLLQSKAINR